MKKTLLILLIFINLISCKNDDDLNTEDTNEPFLVESLGRLSENNFRLTFDSSVKSFLIYKNNIDIFDCEDNVLLTNELIQINNCTSVLYFATDEETLYDFEVDITFNDGFVETWFLNN